MLYLFYQITSLIFTSMICWTALRHNRPLMTRKDMRTGENVSLLMFVRSRYNMQQIFDPDTDLLEEDAPPRGLSDIEVQTDQLDNILNNSEHCNEEGPELSRQLLNQPPIFKRPESDGRNPSTNSWDDYSEFHLRQQIVFQMFEIDEDAVRTMDGSILY